MIKNKTDLSVAFSSQYKEMRLDDLSITGQVPEWLSGCFISNGPAQFEVGTTHFNHWFDGFAMLKKFDFNKGRVVFQNRFLRSQEFIESNKWGELNKNEFATYASNNTFRRMLLSIRELFKGNSHDNCVVNTAYLSSNYIAMTESNRVISFDINNLNTNGLFDFKDSLPGHFAIAHPHVDTKNGELINIAVEIGRFNKYHVYKIAPSSQSCDIIQTYVDDQLFYIHSFSITKNHIILYKSPLVMNKLKLMLGLPFNNTLSYKTDLTSFFIIINRTSGKTYELEADPFVCLHPINAFESKHQITLDVVCHFGENPYNKLFLSNLCAIKPKLPAGEIRRYEIDLQSNRCQHRTLSLRAHEFPRINYRRCNGSNYDFFYTNVVEKPGDQFFKVIEKFNIKTGEIQCFNKKDYYFGEPLFVEKTNASSEDDGLLLSIAYNNSTQLSSLVIIDSLSMELVAEVHLPFHLPFGLHGQFYSNH